jgi:hypothetical protein
MMIEYSIEGLKNYYSNSDRYGCYGNSGSDIDTDATTSTSSDYTADDIKNIHRLEDSLSDMIDNEHTQNNIYHLFPSVVFFAFASFLLGMFQ